MNDEHKALHRRFFEEVFSEGRLELIDELFAPGYRNHDPANPPLPEGPEGARQLVALYRTASPDIRFTIEAQVAEGDLVVSRWTATGTHTGDLMGIPPSGRSWQIPGVAIDRVEEGKLAEHWGYWHTLGFMQQIGVVPEMG